ncbi:hypothetical protein, partial [Mediterraneibacter gnavus]|uniref:hypothetical protein n=1 Tax=Mediterraneibacter gnavus TaxID=33038 RepID=UPI0034A268E7
PRGIVLPVCSGIRFHVHKPESDGRAGPGGIWEYGTMDESSNAWVCPQILQYTRTTERERILSASWMLRL